MTLLQSEKNVIEIIYFENIFFFSVGSVLLLLKRELNGELFLAWYFETCNSLLRLFRPAYKPEGKLLGFDRKKRKEKIKLQSRKVR